MAKKAHFTPRLFTFLSELRLHNDREWFERNKERYLRDVRDPMLRFISDFAPVLRKIAPRVVADPRPVGGSLFRLHRDTRFSPNKTPYKTNVAAHFRHEAGRDVHGPGYYVSLDPDEVAAGGGVWHPESDALRMIRRSIFTTPGAWRRATETSAMKRLVWWGESLSRAPRGFPDHHVLADMLKRKDFAAGIEFESRDACSSRFLDRCAEIYRALTPTMKLLARAQGLPW
ncbi:MAG TPA: DUF2461 domain-containing protein [Anaeromyxobacteraceae bacterium]|nr:DUF2461 domain-containing protein [Anaeromyxobacteraceae bacterium]